ncbi:HEAT repeat domain-containing protein [Candidatus Methylomirabilis sp.]|uniref:HEAT repeat domain-containing protein n=1 Tax=Candidatus Methylomirabilis sp. TaxID=2032687 RepID=UPI002A66C26F|nr:HEAT repeat domain-containing protein [Candidatus Methylomirabilis sp.]
MNEQDLAKYAGQLDSRIPLLGPRLRREACRKLAEDSSPGAVRYLVQALRSDDAEVRSTAAAALRALKDAAAVDALCALWSKERDEQLGRIVAECGYVAIKPVELRVLSALKANRPEVAGESEAAVKPLVDAQDDRDQEIAKCAKAALNRLTNAAAVDALCELAIADPAGAIAALVKEAGYLPQSVGRRCVLFLLTKQFQRYLDLDPEFQHLRAEYRVGDKELRRRISSLIRGSGDTRLMGLFRESRRRQLASELTEQETATVIDVYARNQQWAEIFALLFQIPLVSAVVGLDRLGQSGWRPESPAEAALLDELIELRSAIAEIPERAPAPGVAFGAALIRWIERGRSAEFAGQSPDTLRKTLLRSSPPDAVAALAALVSSGKFPTGDIEKVRTHRHWLVRLAGLALCEIATQFVFSETPSGRGGGRIWIERLAPAVLDRALYRRRAVSLSADQLDALQAALAPGGDRKNGRWAYGRLIEALARHRLQQTVAVDAQMTVEILEPAIEIEE